MFDYAADKQTTPLHMRRRCDLGTPTRDVTDIPRSMRSVSGSACELLQSRLADIIGDGPPQPASEQTASPAVEK